MSYLVNVAVDQPTNPSNLVKIYFLLHPSNYSVLIVFLTESQGAGQPVQLVAQADQHLGYIIYAHKILRMKRNNLSYL